MHTQYQNPTYDPMNEMKLLWHKLILKLLNIICLVHYGSGNVILIPFEIVLKYDDKYRPTTCTKISF